MENKIRFTYVALSQEELTLIMGRRESELERLKSERSILDEKIKMMENCFPQCEHK